ncbi:MAG: hypothetical protein GY759_13520 [Chloroflexi bacterium]|nr:hypothetical protein [Chloroflexota bacterium]
MHIFTRGDVFSWLGVETPVWLNGLRLVLILLVICVVVWAMRRPPSKTGDDSETQDLDLSLVILVMLLISPITWYHYYMWLLLPLTIRFDHLFLAPQVDVRRIAWLAVAYGLLVVQGIAVLQPLAAQALQDVWILRLLLSQSFFGAVLLLGLTLKLRLQAGERSV